MSLFAYVDKNSHRGGCQNNNANYNRVHVIRTKRPGKKDVAYMLRNSLKNGLTKLHIMILEVRENKPFQFSLGLQKGPHW